MYVHIKTNKKTICTAIKLFFSMIITLDGISEIRMCCAAHPFGMISMM